MLLRARIGRHSVICSDALLKVPNATELRMPGCELLLRDTLGSSSLTTLKSSDVEVLPGNRDLLHPLQSDHPQIEDVAARRRA